MSSIPFDQRWVRKSSEGFRSLGEHNLLCDACGKQADCHIKRGLDFMAGAWNVDAEVKSCPVFVPVFRFESSKGLKGIFNTFRRGEGWTRRAPVGTRVMFWTKDAGRIIGSGTVIATHVGDLREMLREHAALNHMCLDLEPEVAGPVLRDILVKSYGRNYAADGEKFCAVYIEEDE